MIKQEIKNKPKETLLNAWRVKIFYLNLLCQHFKTKEHEQTRKTTDTSWAMFLTQILQLHTTTTQKAHALIIDVC